MKYLKKCRRPLPVLITGLMVTILSIGAVQAGKGKIQAGVLDCVVKGGTGFIIGSTKHLVCIFDPVGSKPNEHYRGTIRKFGIDIGVTKETHIVWGVFAPSKKVVRGALQGSYGGVSAEATAVVGLGANVLIGGFDKSFTLQPLSLQAQTGLNIAIGITNLELRAVGN